MDFEVYINSASKYFICCDSNYNKKFEVGDSSTLSKLPFYTDFITYAIQKKCLLKCLGICLINALSKII